MNYPSESLNEPHILNKSLKGFGKWGTSLSSAPINMKGAITDERVGFLNLLVTLGVSFNLQPYLKQSFVFLPQ